MIRKIIVALLSSVVFSLSLAVAAYTPAFEREPNTYYFSFLSLVMIYLTYAAPVYLLGGVPCCILIDMVERNMNISHVFRKYFFHIAAYTIAGMLTTFIFLLVLSGGKVFDELLDSSGFFLFGVIASLLYYHLYLISFFITKKLRG
ncbi:MAG: hypothetical protein H0Z34_15185 [Brevibacillus sp.]|nr:hypothetical protein [Brevibacillus sp.]